MDWISTLVGSVSTGAALLFARYIRLYVVKKQQAREDRKENRDDADADQERQHSNTSFVIKQYQEEIKLLIQNRRRENEQLEKELAILRKSASDEAHHLRGELQAALLKAAILEERERNRLIDLKSRESS